MSSLTDGYTISPTQTNEVEFNFTLVFQVLKGQELVPSFYTDKKSIMLY